MACSLLLKAVSYRYRDKAALHQLTAKISGKAITALLGPNGSGKSTLFNILATHLPLQEGEATLELHDRPAVSLRPPLQPWRAVLGVVFQNPSLDKKLTVLENMRYHAWLFGIKDSIFLQRSRFLLDALKIQDYAHAKVETLSGGIARRAEIAKTLLAQPRLLLLDEPSTGLDPIARRDLMDLLRRLVSEEKILVFMTTHFTDEAEQADQVLILDQGHLVANGAPSELKKSCPFHVIRVEGDFPSKFVMQFSESFRYRFQHHPRHLRIECPIDEDPEGLARWIRQTLDGTSHSITISPPTLEDVFFKMTGHTFTV
ncbi:MAG: ABC transporter ATP-binding protein [Methylacidiphilales bacterium]|nr:ABC transporter ATP-binding protein [Candidatus Methylacidiphilales bacterium]MDW8349981.1 ABC transporter ATP-binding protein [Verrucomicrobiae bacterium]